jgi:hypothetical protein
MMAACVERTLPPVQKNTQFPRRPVTGWASTLIPCATPVLTTDAGLFLVTLGKDRRRNPLHGLQTFKAWGSYVSEIIALCDSRDEVAPKMPIVSVVITNFNHRPYICEAINSVQQQTYRKFE